MNNAALAQLVIIAVLVEAIWENVKRLYSAEGFDKSVGIIYGIFSFNQCSNHES